MGIVKETLPGFARAFGVPRSEFTIVRASRAIFGVLGLANEALAKLGPRHRNL